MLLILLKGLLVGLVIAAPVGPIAMVCIGRTLAEGRTAGLATGLGAALADSLYGAAAGFGLTAISVRMVEQGLYLKIFGGIILIAMGIKTIVLPPVIGPINGNNKKPTLHGGLLVDLSTTFLLTLSNPVTILAAAAVFAGLGQISLTHRYSDAGLLVLGVFTGSALWWLFLSFSAHWIRNWLRPQVMVWLTRGIGAIIIIFGVVVLVSAGT